MRELRLGLVGCGRLAERGYVPAARRATGLRLAAVADAVAARCASAAPGVPSFAGAAELLEAGVADVLVLATPAASHLPDARRAAAAGVPALVEKPPAATAREAAELVALDPAPWIGFNRRFDPGVAALREDARAVPKLELVLLIHTRQGSWRPYEVEEPVLLELGPHPVDLALWLSDGRAERVSARIAGRRATLLVELADGRGRAHIECFGDRPYRERIEVRGEGRAISGHRAGGLLRGLRATTLGRRAESPLVPSLVAQLEALARAVRGSREPRLATAADGLTVMRTLETAQASAGRTGAWEPVPKT